MSISLILQRLRSAQESLVAGLGVLGVSFAIGRLLQLLSAVWLSRVLSPSEFGILAVVAAVQAFSMQVTSLNLGSELVRSKKLDPLDVEVAWSYEFLRNTALWAIVFIPADLWAELLNLPDAARAMRISSFGFIISALRNPYAVRIRRDKLFVLMGVMDVVPAVILAFGSVLFVALSGQYMGVVYAGLVSLLVSTCCSYLAFPACPRFRLSLRRAAPMLSFGGKLFGAGVVGALESNFPVFFIASLGQSQDVGYLNRAWAFSIAIALSLTAIIWRVCYPHFAQTFVAGRSPLPRAFHVSALFLAAGLAAATMSALFSKEIIGTVLGEQWLKICGLWSLLLFAGALNLAASPLATALQATRNETSQITIFCASAFSAVVLYWVLYSSMGIFGIGVAAILANALLLIGYCTLCRVLVRRSP